jgi:GTP pyrophosphokinase
MLYGWMKNIWCILVKLADREHNLATLSFMPEHKQVKKSFESQSLYLPLMSILKFDEWNISIETCEIQLKKYLLDNNISNSKDFKNNLFNTCFHDFSEELFDVVYNNSSQVVWKIEDKKLFDWLLESGWFDSESVDLKKIEITWDWKFRANFIFKWGSTFDFSKWKISLSSSNFIS